MRTWAEIEGGGVVRHVARFDDEFVPQAAPPLQYVEITGLDPLPAEGWQYDPETRKFSPPPTPAPKVYIHIGLSVDGSTIDPPGIPDDGSVPLQVSVALRSGPAPDAPVLPITGDWRITVRQRMIDQDGTPYPGPVYLAKMVHVTDGVATLEWTPPLTWVDPAGKHRAVSADLQIFQGDMDVRLPHPQTGELLDVVLVGAPRFKVYEP